MDYWTNCLQMRTVVTLGWACHVWSGSWGRKFTNRLDRWYSTGSLIPCGQVNVTVIVSVSLFRPLRMMGKRALLSTLWFLNVQKSPNTFKYSSCGHWPQLEYLKVFGLFWTFKNLIEPLNLKCSAIIWQSIPLLDHYSHWKYLWCYMYFCCQLFQVMISFGGLLEECLPC